MAFIKKRKKGWLLSSKEIDRRQLRFTTPCVFLLRLQGTKMINRLNLLDCSFQVIKEGWETLK